MANISSVRFYRDLAAIHAAATDRRHEPAMAELAADIDAALS